MSDDLMGTSREAETWGQFPSGRRMIALMDLRRRIINHLAWVCGGANVTNADRIECAHVLTNPEWHRNPALGYEQLTARVKEIAANGTQSDSVAVYARAVDFFQDAATALEKADDAPFRDPAWPPQQESAA